VERSTEEALLSGRTGPSTLENLETILSKKTASTSGQMADAMTDSGILIKCTAKEYLTGQTAVATKDNTAKIKSMDMVRSPGKRAATTKATG